MEKMLVLSAGIVWYLHTEVSVFLIFVRQSQTSE